MRLLEHTLSSDASIHLGGLVVEGIPASDRITRAVPPRAARADTKHLHLYSICSEIEKVLISFSMFSYLFLYLICLFESITLTVLIYCTASLCLTMNA